jgi:PTH1 family peptidyl-tRNA hydrolase
LVGLRNPGPDYEGSRHNVGAEVVARLAGDHGAAFKRAPQRIRAVVATVELDVARPVLALPVTFMNDSGGAVSPLIRYYKVQGESLVLVHDDIDLPFGKLRFQFGRGSGGHNGVESVVGAFGSEAMWRLKVGVGRPPGNMNPADFVLRRFYDRERPDVDLLVSAAAGVLEVFARAGGEAARQEAGEATGRLGIAAVDPREA